MHQNFIQKKKKLNIHYICKNIKIVMKVKNKLGHRITYKYQNHTRKRWVAILFIASRLVIFSAAVLTTHQVQNPGGYTPHNLIN